MNNNPFGNMGQQNTSAQPKLPLGSKAFGDSVGDTFKTWAADAQATAKDIGEFYGRTLYDQSLRVRQDGLRVYRFENSRFMDSPIDAMSKKYDLPQVKSDFEQNKAARDQTATNFRNDLQQDYNDNIAKLNEAYHNQKQALKGQRDAADQNPNLSDAEKTAKIAELDGKLGELKRDYLHAQTAYRRWQEDRLAAGVRACNQAAKLASIAMDSDPKFDSDLQPDPAQLSATGDTITEGTKLQIGLWGSVKGAKFKPGMLDDIAEFFGAETFSQQKGSLPIVPTIRKGENGLYPDLGDLSQFKLQQHKPLFSKNYTTAIHTGLGIQRAYLSAFQHALVRDPNMAVDIYPILGKFPSDQERKQFIFHMVHRFGNIPMGIEADPKYMADKQEAIQKLGCDRELSLAPLEVNPGLAVSGDPTPGTTARANPGVSSGASIADNVSSNHATQQTTPTLTIEAPVDENRSTLSF